MVAMPAHVAALIAEYTRPPPRSVWIVQVATTRCRNDSLYVFTTKDDADEFIDAYEELENDAADGGISRTEYLVNDDPRETAEDAAAEGAELSE